jgi:cell division septation protein DedD
MGTSLVRNLETEPLMQLETGHPICSLCKREMTGFSFEGGPGTKLCEQCRGLIQTALHRTEPRAVAVSAGVQPGGAATSYLQSAQSDPSAVVRAESSPGFFEDFSAYSDTGEQSQAAEFSNADHEPFEMHFEDEPFAVRDSETNSVAAPVVERTEHCDETFVGTTPASESIHAEFSAEFSAEFGAELSDLHLSLSDNGNAGALPDESDAIEQSFPAATPGPAVSGEHMSGQIQSAQSMTEAAPADPWEDPLPAWDYSRSEWPVLMGPPRGRSFAKFKLPAALLLILAFGAGFYYLIYPQISRDQPLPDNSVLPGRAAETVVATKQRAEPLEQGQAPSTPDAPASEQAQPQQESIRDSGVPGATRTSATGASETGANETGNARGRFALQAAAFPTQAGADELAEKLKSAGVPSYVVSADLARRGRWFRVRVGRFNTAEDAQKFAAEAQRRAKSASMSLQLIVSQYEQP